MTRDEVRAICKRVNNGENLEDIVRKLNIRKCYMESLIKEFGFKYSKVLEGYYSEEFEEEIIKKEKEINSFKVMDNIEELWLKRYYGININDYDGVIEEEWADSPRQDITIDLSYELYNELSEIADENGTSIDLIIESYLLKLLERNRETKSNKKTEAYLKNICEDLFSLKSTQEQLENETDEDCLTRCFEQKEEFLKEIKNNVKRKGFLIEPLTYKDTHRDCEIYMKSYLVDKGYTKENIAEIEDLEEKIKYEFPLTDHYDYKSDDEYKDMTYEEIKEILLKAYYKGKDYNKYLNKN